MEIIEKVNVLDRLEHFRYATKKFDVTKKLSQQDFSKVLKAITLSASAYGLQPYKFIVVEDPEVREKLKGMSKGQTQITDASHLIVFAHQQIVDNAQIETYIDNIAVTRNISRETLRGFETMMKGTVANLNPETLSNWNARQTYIALGNLLTYCALEGIDACPMEGFDSNAYDEILGLKEKGLHAIVVAAIGYRANDDTFQFVKKVRKPLNEIVEVI
ncbi:NAD(P)H-dependent oxidoreductase [Solitalea lacus]|uniref:NAD(P)H-dependent oxidoreductase n=1 Tax=Solitalea lacus TaxID=2911172 RepID=UPI001EDB0D65|nr:NAD(P)H-dependent oxidoreductase [Solitalea lacus]UKJ07804.1 NAD(P)H-dependent oxidoreductase [Solitalea lacus]